MKNPLKVLITSGGTKVSIDAVRSITNMSRGTFGSAICKRFLEKGHHVDFLMAEGSRSPFKFEVSASKTDSKEYLLDFINWHLFVEKYHSNYFAFEFKTFEDYHSKIKNLFSIGQYDVIVLACAASDYGVANYMDGKIRSGNSMSIELTPYPKIISSVREMQPNTYLVGFKLMVKSEYSELIEAASKSLDQNKCDMVVANDLNDIKSNDHKLLIVENPKKGSNEKQITRFDKDYCYVYGKTLAESLVDFILNNLEDKKS